MPLPRLGWAAAALLAVACGQAADDDELTMFGENAAAEDTDGDFEASEEPEEPEEPEASRGVPDETPAGLGRSSAGDDGGDPPGYTCGAPSSLLYQRIPGGAFSEVRIIFV